MVIQHLEQIRKVQKLVKWVSQKLTTNQKNCHFEVSSSLILHNSKPFLDRIGMWDKKWVHPELTANQKNCHFEVSSSLILHNNRWFLDLIVIWDEKWILHDSQWWPVQWLNQEAAPKHFPKPNLHQKKGHSHCFMICWATTAFWILVKSLHLISMFSKSLRCNACSHHGLTERTQFFSVTTPRHTSHNQWFKSWKSGLWHFASSEYSPDLSSNDYHFFKHLDNFLQGKRFHNQQDAENALQEFIKSQSMDFYATGVNKLISHWQKCADCNGSYFD